MKLAFDDYPGAGAPPLIVAHGVFGSARNWRALAKRMGGDRRVIAVDMRNHGRSGWDDAHDYFAMAGDLAETIEDIGAPAAVLGHSMGGKASMVLAATRPELVERLIVADIAPVAYGHDLMDEIRAMQSVDLSAATRRGDVDAALARTIAEAPVRAFLATSANLAAEPKRWDLNLDALAANMDVVTGFPDLDAGYDGRTLFLSGAMSNYVDAAGADAARTLFPATEFEVIAGAGHWLHAEKPREFLDAVNRFLAG